MELLPLLRSMIFRHNQEHNKPKIAYADCSTLNLRIWGIWGCCERHFHAPRALWYAIAGENMSIYIHLNRHKLHLHSKNSSLFLKHVLLYTAVDYRLHNGHTKQTRRTAAHNPHTGHTIFTHKTNDLAIMSSLVTCRSSGIGWYIVSWEVSLTRVTKSYLLALGIAGK